MIDLRVAHRRVSPQRGQHIDYGFAEMLTTHAGELPGPTVESGIVRRHDQYSVNPADALVDFDQCLTQFLIAQHRARRAFGKMQRHACSSPLKMR